MKTMRVLAVAASTAAILGTGLSAQAAPTATSSSAGTSATQAATGQWDCPKYRLCVWTGKNGTGTRAVFKYGDVNLGDSTGPRGMNNNITSFWNRTGRHWRLYNGTGYNGTSRLVHVDGEDGSFDGDLGWRTDNKTSSIKRLPRVL